MESVAITIHVVVSCDIYDNPLSDRTTVSNVIPILQNEATDVNQESLAASKFFNCVSAA